TITPSMVLVLVSRKVNGLPVGVEPTFNTVCACAAPQASVAASAAARNLSFMDIPLGSSKGEARAARLIWRHAGGPASPAGPHGAGSWAALPVVGATDGPDDFRHIRAGIAPAPRRAAVIAEAVARAQQDDAILEPQLELASQHQADLLAHAGGEQLLA